MPKVDPERSAVVRLLKDRMSAAPWDVPAPKSPEVTGLCRPCVDVLFLFCVLPCLCAPDPFNKNLGLFFNCKNGVWGGRGGSYYSLRRIDTKQSL